MLTRRTVLVSICLMSILACGGSGGPDAPAPAAARETPPAPPVPEAPASGPPTDGTANVSGTVRYDGEVPKLPTVRMDADPGCIAKHSSPVVSERLVLGDGNTMANVLVRVRGGLPDRPYPPSPDPATLDQLGCRYTPHVIGLMVGQDLKILNSDALLHNVHSQPKINKGFNRAMPATTTEATFVFDKVEDPFPIKCDVHPWMNAYIAVLAHPYFSVTGEDGAFSLSGLAAGTYEVEAWHERLGTKTESVTVADGETATIDFTFSR